MSPDRKEIEAMTAAKRNEDFDLVLDGGSSTYDPLLPAVRSTLTASFHSKAEGHNKPAAARPT
jgi:hypothetical protein